MSQTRHGEIALPPGELWGGLALSNLNRPRPKGQGAKGAGVLAPPGANSFALPPDHGRGLWSAPMSKVVALSGGIGSGKTTVRRILDELGAVTICADAIVHELQAPGSPILEEISAAFGAGVLDSEGGLDRAALGEIVFSDPEARGRLGVIMHPPVMAEMMRQAQDGTDSGAPLVVLDIPLYFEGQRSGTGSAVAREYDAALLVWVPPEVQIERTAERDACPRAEAERRVAAQMPIDEKRRYATHVIDNSGDLESTRHQVEKIFGELAAPE